MKYKPVIGLEVHVELSTKSKMFCGCPADHFGKQPNSQTCPVCLGLPGALPVPNKSAIDSTILLGLALGCKINPTSKFDRKNYFYPDLPKGYQISQYDQPLAIDGELKITVGENEKTIRIRRVHIEEDTGKLQHSEIDNGKVALVDFNRSGVPLMEIVSEPDFESVEEVDVFLKKLQGIVSFLKISGADMEKGSMRLEPSISLGDGKTLPSYRVELKNINSFRFARKALEFEIQRQTEILEKGETPTQQTRGWSEAKNSTLPQREKEEANDYRYFPEPDIPPLEFSDQYIQKIKSEIPELPDAKSLRFQKEYSLTKYSADILCDDFSVADYFEEATKLAKDAATDPESPPATIANWIINKKIDVANSVPADLVRQIISAKQATTQLPDEEIDAVVKEVLNENPQIVQQFKSGKKGVIGFLMGKVVVKLPNVEKAVLMGRLQKLLEE